MFKIRDEQVRALERSTRREFESRLVDHLERFFAAQCRSLGSRGLRAAAHYGLGKAKSHGFSSERDVCKYLDLMFTFGRDFDTRPDLSWAGEILELRGRPSRKMVRLLNRAFEEVDQAYGFGAEQGASPRQPALFVRQRPFASDRTTEWVRQMSRLIRYYCRREPFFRWDDSRDLESVEHLRAILEVARRTPRIRHWLPTREHELVGSFLRTYPEDLPTNLLIRVEATEPDNPAPSLAGLPTATRHEAAPPLGAECPGSCGVGGCGACRICWSPEVATVAFPQGRWEPGAERVIA